MKLTVAGRDRHADLGADLSREAEALTRRAPLSLCSAADSALNLRESASMDDYLHRYARLLRMGAGLRTALGSFPAPPAPGLWPRIRRAFRGPVLRWLCHEHAYLAHQQSAFNELTAIALELHLTEARAQRAALEQRVAALEARSREGRP